ncbi:MULTISPECIES: lysozyme inhibitor LprI family protein [Xenorhabdus]|uniref:lysozyme inhibitor LprI family protein n=1 Tax=Xenorhabdus TaxID=626 RepID=UPI00069AAC2A|nr:MULTISPECIES: hypothetical protein [Xenorhabdus]WFQ80514.1 hypothetical protein PXH59_05100 [Xenorhabdus sp. SF857]
MLKKIAVALSLVATTATSTSFDCTKATSKAEKLICSTPALSQADDTLYVDYLQAKVVTGNSNDFKKLVKQNWKLREKNCETEECLLGWYKRSTELYRQIAAIRPKQNVQAEQQAQPERKAPERSKSVRQTIDDFFDDNPELSENIYLRKAIKDAVSGESFSDTFSNALTSKQEGVSMLRAMKDNVTENGYNYARLAVRSLQDSCNIGMGSVFGLRGTECQILSRYRDTY